MVATGTDLLHIELVAFWSFIALSSFSWEFAHGLLDDFEFCKHEQLVPLYAILYPKPSYLRKTKKIFQIPSQTQNFLLIKCSSWQWSGSIGAQGGTAAPRKSALT
jgi:hypothetical protein